MRESIAMSRVLTLAFRVTLQANAFLTPVSDSGTYLLSLSSGLLEPDLSRYFAHFHQAGPGFCRLYLSRLHLPSPAGANFFGKFPPISCPRARATAVVMIKRIPSRTLQVRRHEETASGREREASFYGALNSDEVARAVPRGEGGRIRIILEQINRPPTRMR